MTIKLLILLMVFGTGLSIFGLLVVWALPAIIARSIGSAIGERFHNESD